ncbi:MAG: tetratricopeptide repeat protein [Flavobacteriales bacterium]|nr:tetratricopeptide repeat protein [Flavobacteriales bacterium]
MKINRTIHWLFKPILIILLFLFSNNVFSNELNKLVNRLPSLNNDTGKVNTLNKIASFYIDSNFINAFQYAQKANKLAQEIDYENGYIESLRLLADANDYLGRYSEAQKLNFQLLDYYTHINDEELINAMNINIGIINYYQSNYNQSIEYTFKALAYYQKINDNLGISICYNNLANVYSDQLNYQMALKHYFKALEIDEKAENIGGICLIKGNIGEVYIELEDYEKAEEYLNSALLLTKITKDKWQEANILTGLGNLKIKQKEENKALLYLTEAFEVNESLGAVAEQSEVFESIFKLYEQQKNYKKALHYLKLFNTYNDSIYNKQTTDKIAEMNAIYDIKEKEKELEAKEAITTSQKKQNVALFASILLLLVIIGLSIKSNLSKKKTNAQLAQQKILIETKNRDITDSIQYAKQIQSAILPSNELLNSAFPDHFVFYQPKDIVAGDFYWLEQENNKILFAAADCTGHGVPGAMVSVVCHNALNRAVKEFKLTQPSKILDKVTDLVIDTFEKNNANIKDGMDIALCSLHQNNDKLNLEYAGANNSIYLIRENNLEEIKSDKQPVGKFINKQPFTNHELPIQKNDILYLFTDGFSDQFGGPKGKKLKYKAFKELLISVHHLPMSKQMNIIKEYFYNWKGDLEQIDDVCIIGIKI